MWRPTRRAEEHYTKDKLSTRRGPVHSIEPMQAECSSRVFFGVSVIISQAESHEIAASHISARQTPLFTRKEHSPCMDPPTAATTSAVFSHSIWASSTPFYATATRSATHWRPDPLPLAPGFAGVLLRNIGESAMGGQTSNNQLPAV